MTLVENIWNVVLDRYSPLQIDLIGNLAVQLLFFWAPSAIYIALPYIYPDFAARKRLQKQENQPTPGEIWDCFTLVLRNQVSTFTLRLVFLLLCARLGMPPSYRFDAELPALWEMKKHIFACVVLREALFYYIHRTLHHPLLYTKFHKKHHRFTAPVALAAQCVSLIAPYSDRSLIVIVASVLPDTHR
jgi:sterol desaturase/sphingolipid hydroxylase (fatty acid hydroxylase superfamily)